MLKSFLRERRKDIVIHAICALIFFVIFMMYHLPLAAVLYPTVLSAVVILIYLGYEFSAFYRKQSELARQLFLPDQMIDRLERYTTAEDRAYTALIRKLQEQLQQDRTKYESSLSDSVDYYTVWVHQIKTAYRRYEAEAGTGGQSLVPLPYRGFVPN